MVFHKFLGKSPFHCQNDRSDNGSASQFDQRKAPQVSVSEKCHYLFIYFGHSRTDLRSLPHSCLLAMTGARSCLERLLSLSSRSMNIVAGCPLEYLPCFGSQSWETVSFLVVQQWPLNCSQHDCCHKSKNI